LRKSAKIYLLDAFIQYSLLFDSAFISAVLTIVTDLLVTESVLTEISFKENLVHFLINVEYPEEGKPNYF